MNDAHDGLDDPQLIHDIVDELSREFPALEFEALTSMVEECRSRMTRPATGGALFLDALKCSLLMADRQQTQDFSSSPSIINRAWAMRAGYF